MENKLELLLKQINFLEYKQYFKDGKLNRIVGNRDKTDYCFLIELNNILPIEILSKFNNSLKEGFPSIRKTSAKFKVSNIVDNDILSYFNYFKEDIIKTNVAYIIFKNIKLKLNENIMEVIVDNSNEKLLFQKLFKSVNNQLISCGINNIKLNVIVDENSDTKVKITVDIPENIVNNQVNQTQDNTSNNPTNKPVRKVIIDDSEEVVMGRVINESKITLLKDILTEGNNITVEVSLYDKPEFFETKTGLIIGTLKVTDFTDSIYLKTFINSKDEFERINSKIKMGNFYQVRGNVKMDSYSKELTLQIRDMNTISKKIESRFDDALNKRVELHVHTKMSQMDGLCNAGEIVKLAHKWGHKAIAITDHNSLQSFPEVYHTVCGLNKGIEKEEDKFRAIYGVELNMVDDVVNIVLRGNDTKLLDNTYVVFDFETTGFNAAGGDSIIEIGAVKIQNGEIIDRFSQLIDPKRPLPEKITEITHITDDMLVGMPLEEEAVKNFINWFEDLPMVAHNAKFDVSFLEMAYSKYNLGTFSNTVIDTLELSRTMDSSFARHSLSALVKRYSVPFDENAHHRADYDAEATAYVLYKMLQKLDSRNFDTINDLHRLVSSDEIHKFGRSFHINILAKDKVGLKNLFKLVSYSSTKYLYKTPRILRSVVEEHREGLLIGSGCYNGEVFVEARSKTMEELNNVISFYDYVELQPIDCYDHLLQMSDFGSKIELINHLKKVVDATKNAGKLIVASGDVHHIENDNIYRKIIVNQKIPGGGRHPLARNNIKEIPSNYFRTTNEMYEGFDYLDKIVADELIVDNPNKIASMVDVIEVIIETGGIPFSPKIENSEQIVKDLVYDKAHSMYGNPLPDNIKERVEYELNSIINGGFDVIYLTSQKLVKKSNDDGYLVGSRGSVGSSFVATMMGITEVNPLPAHYLCPGCKLSIFNDENDQPYGNEYSSGYDLPKKKCPKCNAVMRNEGQDMPFATFLGFNADKVPDIDLNFSGDNQSKIHEYTKELFGVDNVFRAGTVGTVADKTAFGYVKGYCEDNGLMMRTAEVERLAKGCTGVKRTSGQHPGGIVVVPGYMDVYDFTPYQFPADDPNSAWRTTHFDYHAIEEDLLKLDILGHQDPTDLRMLQDLSGIDVTTLPFTDKKVLSILSSTKELGVTPEQIMCPIGALGIPELGTKFVMNMLVETKPKTFAELVKISGLSHGTDVWAGNARDLIMNNVVPFKEVIGCRDDIMVSLMNWGVKPKTAFDIMEFVRKGRPTKQPDIWQDYAATLKEAKIPEWYIESCRKIKYMFPKAHAVAYVMSALRIAWFKVHKPLFYYTAYFSNRPDDYDIDVMIKGYDAIKNKIIEITNKGYDVTNKETAILECLKVALEATARGFKFANIDLNESDSMNFKIKDETTLYPPFKTIEGLGDTVAHNIVEERVKKPFLSIEDLQKRCKISSTLIEKMRMMKILDGMDESSQLSLF